MHCQRPSPRSRPRCTGVARCKGGGEAGAHVLRSELSRLASPMLRLHAARQTPANGTEVVVRADLVMVVTVPTPFLTVFRPVEKVFSTDAPAATPTTVVRPYGVTIETLAAPAVAFLARTFRTALPSTTATDADVDPDPVDGDGDGDGVDWERELRMSRRQSWARGRCVFRRRTR